MAERTVTPVAWTPSGEAWCEDRGRKVIVFGGIPDEAENVQVEHVGQHQVRAKFLSPAGRTHRARRAPPCKRFNLCGGCPLMHVVPEAQAKVRLGRIFEAYDQVGLGDFAPRELVASPDGDVDYRHVVKLAVGRSDYGRHRVGGFGRGTRKVVTIPDCLVVTPVLREGMKVVSHRILDMDIWPYDPQTGKGVLRYVVMRQSRATGEVLVTLVAARSHGFLRQLGDAIMESWSAASGVHLHINETEGNAIFNWPEDSADPFTRLSGNRSIEERLGELRVVLGPGDFFQTNPSIAERMTADLVATLEPQRALPVVDLYAGAGGMTLALAQAHGWALGVEQGIGAIERAKVSARLNQVRAEFMAGKVVDLFPEISRRVADRGPVVVVDPARRGLEEGVIDGILALKPSRLAYISCETRNQAPDLQRLVSEGWRIDMVKAYDMFPQTAHVEVLTVLSPPQAPTVKGRAPRRRVVR